MNHRLSLLALPWLGCSETDMDSADAEPVPGVEITLTDFQTRACWADAQGTDSLTTSQVGVGAIAVVHELELQDCTALSATAYADEDVLHVVYDRVPTGECGAYCWFRVEYMLTGVPAGEWWIQVEDWSSEVSVP